MDPSSGRDSNSNSNSSSNSPSTPENPFIRFKNFADTQISTLLQGVIGLPSAFSKRSSEDGRWADIDEDLRRRDRLQARDRMLKAQLDMKSASGEEIPVQKLAKQQVPQTSDQVPSSGEFWKDTKSYAGLERREGSNVEMDLPLYSPVTRELFDNVRRPEYQSDLDRSRLSPGENSFKDFQFALMNDLLDRREPLRATRLLAFEHVKDNPSLRSDYSLLPYLLFSPYSPLKLDADIHGWGALPDSYPVGRPLYCAAFDDLIRTTQGLKEPPTPIYQMSLPWSTTGLSDFDNWRWIKDLYRRGMLQQKGSVWAPMPASQIWKDLAVQEDSGTELDAFEQLHKLMGNGATLLATVQSMFDALNPEEQRQSGSTNLHDMIAQARERAIIEDRQSQSTIPPKQEKDKKQVTNDVRPDRIVSTSTTTERTTHEDGTVETCVTIWKRYDDGRETTTTTTHTEDPGWDDKEQPDWPDEAASRQVGEKNLEDDKKDQKKGWFWN
ncbi:uncharacterized protein LY89DRAFT_60739 [Mollisia scopiformis]|uniref:Uncharacterized protein n=1 Tax=Mollisia scopiformis TaxID=149040 RepID=A0A194XDC6_MOLSC|nr:uncharacterized protein LY89DRAFT_60739 [Mollisia scopiformis]KUJ17757.1 hypothetical protein LY89DRAFT_60739 [Mollisia scopiformis]